MINNLLDNAIKFSSEGGSIVVKLFTDPFSEHVVLQVSDTGTGIPPEDLPHVFERLSGGQIAAASRTSGRNGTGIEHLPVDRRRPRRDHRDRQRIGRGTTVTVKLPSARWPDARNRPAAENDRNSCRDLTRGRDTG